MVGSMSGSWRVKITYLKYAETSDIRITPLGFQLKKKKVLGSKYMSQSNEIFVPFCVHLIITLLAKFGKVGGS